MKPRTPHIIHTQRSNPLSILVASFLALQVVLWLTTDPEVRANTPPPAPQLTEQEDGPLQVWKKKAKFYLVIAVDQTGVPGTELPFAKTDGIEVQQALEAHGYQPLLATQPIGEQATQGNVITALQAIRELPEWATVIVYYSGHGVKDPTDKDVWLQLAGQTQVSDHLGISIGGLIETARGASYLGELHILVDACFSGKGTLTGNLTLKEFGKNTTVLTSSSDIQNSYPIQVDPTRRLSAFTHTLLRAWGPEWGTADDNGDGILQFPELATFSILELKKYFLQKAIDAEMRPQLLGAHHEEIFFGYRREHVTRWHSTTREALNILALERSLITRVTVTPGKDPVTPAIPQEAQTLAKQVSPAPDDFYVLGLQAQAEGRMEEADTLLQQAEAQEEEHKEKLAKIYLARGRNHTYQGQYQAALPWYQKTLALKPTKDPERLNEFGTAFYMAGRYDEALPILHEALTLREKTLNQNDPDLATSLNNLAELYRAQGKYAEAEPLYQRALRITETALGPDHPSVAIRLNNLALLYKTQGKYAEAEPLYQRSFWILVHGLGTEHPYVQQSFGNYQAFLEASGQPHGMEDVVNKLQEALPSINTQSPSPSSSP